MLLSAVQLAALLESLGLTQSLFKPIPDLVGGLTAPLDGVVNSVDGIAHGLGLPGLSDLPLLGSILEADNPSTSKDLFKSMSVANSHILSTDGSCSVQPYNPPPVLSQTFPPFDQAKANIFRYRQQQAVNLGSWFVHEWWMTPSLFTCASGPKTSELDIATGWGNTTGARAVLERHWDTFIKQSDFQYLASIGINTVRLPIGYWSLGPLYCQGTPFEPVAEVYKNSWSRVVRAINWAGEAGIGVLIDLHGAVGSQNGQPHSGISDGQRNFFSKKNMDATINVLTFMTQQMASVTNVVGIEILNEPYDDNNLLAFNTRAITAMRQSSTEAATLPLYIHDAFNVQRLADFVASRDDFIVEDHHSYFVFNPHDASLNATQEADQVKSTVSDQLTSSSQKVHRNLIVGEWSCALVSNALSGQEDPLSARQQFCQGQKHVYANATAGWHFWSYMKEGCDTDLDWCFKNAVGNTLPSTFFAYNSTHADKAPSLARVVAKMELPSMVEVLDQANDQSAPWPSSKGVTPAASDSGSASESSDFSSATPGSSHLKRDLDARHQRFFSIHSRRSSLSDMSKHKKDGMPSPLTGLAETERSIIKGYSDGFLTAKEFAQLGMSKLGFTGQYISDSIAVLGPKVVAPGTEEYYTKWFILGMKDGEKAVSVAIK